MGREEVGKERYFEPGCRRYGRSDRDLEKHLLGEGGLRRLNRRGICMGDLASLNISDVDHIILMYGAYGFVEQLLVLSDASSRLLGNRCLL